MKKVLCIVLALISVLALAACAGKEPTAKDVDLAVLKSDMLSQLSVENANDINSAALLGLYGIAAEDIEASACYTTMNGVFPDEVVMIKAVDAAAAARVAEKLNTRVEQVKVQSENYDAENYALAQKCEVVTEGNYVAMFLSPSYDTLVQLFNEAVK